MRILNLVLYSDTTENECYDEMFALTQKFYQTFEPDVRTIYYKYSKIDTDFYLQDNVLSIKGRESFVPGVLDKTLKAFQYVIENSILDDYDLVIRSNVSTIVDFALLKTKLQENGIPYYGGGKVENLQWEGGGITDNTWFGTLFVSGTSIILSKDAVKFIVDNKNKVKMDIIDDVSIAIFFMTEQKELAYPPVELKQFLYMPCFFKNTVKGLVFYLNELLNFVKSKKTIFYRNNCTSNRVDRRFDIIQMKHIIDFLTIK